MTDLIDDDWTEAVDANIPRVDLVGKAANGSGGFLLMKQDTGGLLDPAHIRSLISKSEPESGPGAANTVTMTGSPAAIAAMIHGAPVRKAGREAIELDLRGSIVASEANMTALGDTVAKAVMSAAKQNDLPDSAFAYIEPGGTKDDEGKTVPRKLRHFPITDEAHVRNALSRAPQSPFGDKAMAKIRAAAKKFGIEVAKVMDMDDGIDGMDPTVVLAMPDEMAPGDPTDPGSPAWESVDAATARKWTAILARARSALGVMSDREMLEAASADPSDADNAFDLDDAACAIDFAISTLAPFAVDEQAEADCGTADMEMLGKALAAFDPAPLDTIEALGQVRKAGRTLSSANENAIRDAVTSLQKVLASLPAPTTEESGQTVAKTANLEPDMHEPTLSEDVTAESGQAPAMGTAEADPKPIAGAIVTDVAKAGKPAQVAIYDANGNLVGTVDPAEITMLTPAQAPTATTDNSADDAPAETEQPPAAEPPATAADLTPAPSAEAGIPADAVPAEDDTVAKATETITTPSQDMLKGIAQDVLKAQLDDWSAAHMEAIAKQAAGLAQANVVTVLEERNQALEKQVEELTKAVQEIADQPAVMAVMGNGALPPKHLLRGQDKGAPVATDQGESLRKQWAQSGDAVEQKRLSDELNGLAIARLQELRQG